MDAPQSHALPLQSPPGVSFSHRAEKARRNNAGTSGRSTMMGTTAQTSSRRTPRHPLPARPTFLPTSKHDAQWLYTKKNVTCFYWARGGCKKTGDSCNYAHYITAIVADSPTAFSHVNSGKAVGGHSSQSIIKDANVRDAEIKDQEARFAERQMAFNGEKVELDRKVKAMEGRLQELELKAYELELRELEVETREVEVKGRETAVEEREKALATV